MDVFNAALQVAALVERPSAEMLAAVRHNFEICGFTVGANVLASAPDATWRDSAVEDKAEDVPAAKRQCTDAPEAASAV